MNLKILNFIIVTFLVAIIAHSYPVQLNWMASPNLNVMGYNIYYGTNSGVYTTKINVGNVTNVIQDGFSNSVYYFRATAYDSSNNESAFSNETTYTNVSTSTYIGMLVNYGDFVNVNTLSIMTYVDNVIGNYYSANLIITNAPVIGTVPNDGNSHTYLCEVLQYGNSILNIQSKTFDLCNFTNPSPFVFYIGFLIETNNPF